MKFINRLIMVSKYLKAFDKVWHERLLLQNGISGNLLKLLRYFLSCRKQVVLNGQHSSSNNATAGVPKGSLRALLISYLRKLFMK